VTELNDARRDDPSDLPRERMGSHSRRNLAVDCHILRHVENRAFARAQVALRSLG